MTDEPAEAAGPTPEAAPDRSVTRLPERATIETATAGKKRDLLPVLYLVGFVALAGTLFYLWQNPPEAHLADQDASRVNTLQTQLATLRGDVANLQQQKPPVPPPAPSQAAFDALKTQVGALEAKPAVGPDQVQQVTQQMAALTQQVQGLGQQVQALPKAPDLQPLTQRIDALEKRPAFDPSPLEGKVAQLGTQIGQGSDQVKQLATRLDALDQQQRQTADQIKAVTQRLQVATKLQGASASLAAGQKLGDIPGAPPALARFATEAPPTEAALRESFDRYAEAAQRASQPGATANQDFGQRLWSRAQQAVTVRQGDRVLVGDPIAGVLAHAREQLDNGSLGGAVETLKQLAGPAAAALQPWVDKAESLVQARAALAALAAG